MSLVRPNQRREAVVKISYDSGSDDDGDVESGCEDESAREDEPAKEPSLQVPPKKKTQAKRMRGSDGEDEMSDGEDEDDSEVMPGGGGWADAMASILRKEAPEGSSAVLAKSKDYAKAKEQERKEFMERLKEKQSKKKWENMARTIPKVTDRERERALQRIATKGVVQLFNAVRKQQKTREEKLKEVGGSQRKRAKVEASLTKGDFLDMLRGTPAPSKTDSNPKNGTGLSLSQPATKENPSWGVLRDDFMLGAKMKDWDKDDSSDESDLDDDNDRKSDEENSGFSSDSD
ncbi:RRP15-like protein isoform X2 [Diadema setosum]|uniref:RRP15-like protein isoform X2 n=1 Tax=Diadema setosum TaxID=31175 RepID=UPI003B3B214B